MPFARGAALVLPESHSPVSASREGAPDANSPGAAGGEALPRRRREAPYSRGSPDPFQDPYETISSSGFRGGPALPASCG